MGLEQGQGAAAVCADFGSNASHAESVEVRIDHARRDTEPRNRPRHVAALGAAPVVHRHEGEEAGYSPNEEPTEASLFETSAVDIKQELRNAALGCVLLQRT